MKLLSLSKPLTLKPLVLMKFLISHGALSNLSSNILLLALIFFVALPVD